MPDMQKHKSQWTRHRHALNGCTGSTLWAQLPFWGLLVKGVLWWPASGIVSECCASIFRLRRPWIDGGIPTCGLCGCSIAAKFIAAGLCTHENMYRFVKVCIRVDPTLHVCRSALFQGLLPLPPPLPSFYVCCLDHTSTAVAKSIARSLPPTAQWSSQQFFKSLGCKGLSATPQCPHPQGSLELFLRYDFNQLNPLKKKNKINTLFISRDQLGGKGVWSRLQETNISSHAESCHTVSSLSPLTHDQDELSRAVLWQYVALSSTAD